MNEEAQQILRKKIERLQVAHAIASDVTQKFQYEKQIEEAQAELAGLGAAPAVTGGLAAPALAAAVEVNPAAAELFVGREAELAQMRAALLGPVVRPVAVVGMPGVGKSYLTDRFALCHQGDFPGGVFRIVLDPENPPASAAPLFGEMADRLKVPAEPAADLAERIRARLLAPRSLLHVENADGVEAGRAAAELVRRLAGCPVVVSARLQSLGTAPGARWERVDLQSFSEMEALEQLQKELGKEGDRVPAADRERLVQELSFLPLAVHLAAGYLLAGQTVPGFLAELRAAGFDLGAADPADPMIEARQGRELLASTLRASVRLLVKQLGPAESHLVEGFRMLGFAQASGFGASLGAALAGQEGDDFELLAGNATRLSLLATVTSKERRGRAWRLHPLLAEVLRAELGEEGRTRAQERTTEWFLARLPEEQQGPAWQEAVEEIEALVAWLTAVPTEDRVRVRNAGAWFAQLNGPFHAWLFFCEEALLHGSLSNAERSDFLWTLGMVAFRSRALDRAYRAAEEKWQIDQKRGAEREAALATGLRAGVLEARGELEEALRILREEELPVYERVDDVRERAACLGRIADVLEVRGELEQALRIRREEQLPVYERLGDVQAWAVCLGKIADVRGARGELEEALRIRREEELPVYERLGDVRARAVCLGKIADVLQARGELEEALRIRKEEELPVYERMGDVRSQAVTLGKIAEVLGARGELEEALRIRREEELPVYERLASRRDVLVCQANTARLLLRRAAPSDREEAARLLHLSLRAAEAMRIPEAERIRQFLHKHGLAAPPFPSLPGKEAG